MPRWPSATSPRLHRPKVPIPCLIIPQWASFLFLPELLLCRGSFEFSLILKLKLKRKVLISQRDLESWAGLPGSWPTRKECFRESEDKKKKIKANWSMETKEMEKEKWRDKKKQRWISRHWIQDVNWLNEPHVFLKSRWACFYVRQPTFPGLFIPSD
jgi:hypothetical protein